MLTKRLLVFRARANNAKPASYWLNSNTPTQSNGRLKFQHSHTVPIGLWFLRPFEANLTNKYLELVVSQRLGKAISHHIVSPNPFELNGPCFNLISHEMPLNINVLGPRVKTGIRCKCYYTLVISFNQNWGLRQSKPNIQFEEQPSKPNGLLYGLGLGHILGLTGRQCDRLLTFGGLTDYPSI